MRISLLRYLLRKGSYILRILQGTYCEGITSNQLCSLFSVIYICRVYTQYYYVPILLLLLLLLLLHT